MSITMNERNEIMRNMKELLTEYDYTYTQDALDDIVDEWAKQKETLIDAFKKHPNYIEGKFMIAFVHNYDRVIDRNVSINFRDWLVNTVIPNMTETLPEDVNNQRIAERCRYLPDKLYWFFKDIEDIAERTLSDETAQKINELLPAIRAREGAKTSRTVNKICTYLGYDKHPDYNREFAKYADSLSPLTIRRHTVISLNPLDYLTMSFGNSWASCHTIDKQNRRGMPNSYSGAYSSGTMSYMLDPSSMVLYTVDPEYDGTDYWTQPKINRQMFHWGEEKLVQSRLYPQDNDGCKDAYAPYRNIVQEVVAKIFDFPNLWSVNRGTEHASKYIESYGTHYKDYTHFSSCTLSRPRDSVNEHCFEVGAEPICIQCGCRHETEDNISCCQNKVVCADCGREIDIGDAEEISGQYYCHDCCYYCSRCESYHRSEEYWVECEDRYVCEYCRENHYARCVECEELFPQEDMTYLEGRDEYVCTDCRDEHYTQCDRCEEWFRDEDINCHGDQYLCDECYAIVGENENENQEEE